MFPEHPFTVWGTWCHRCGTECSILEDEHHPWDHTSYQVNLKCPSCGCDMTVDQRAAEAFYNDKIYSYFSGVSGRVIDLGCGSGFLSRYLLQNPRVDSVYGLDGDHDCMEATADLATNNEKFSFIQSDIRNLKEWFKPGRVDFAVSRDVFMFVEDTERFFDDVTAITTRGIIQMGWFMKDNPRMKNRLEPQKIVRAFKKRGWQASLDILGWYKSGYCIRATLDKHVFG